MTVRELFFRRPYRSKLIQFYVNLGKSNFSGFFFYAIGIWSRILHLKHGTGGGANYNIKKSTKSPPRRFLFIDYHNLA